MRVEEIKLNLKQNSHIPSGPTLNPNVDVSNDIVSNGIKWTELDGSEVIFPLEEKADTKSPTVKVSTFESKLPNVPTMMPPKVQTLTIK